MFTSTSVVGPALLILAIIIGFLLYLLFRDTMNRIQYVEHLRIYWITKNTGHKGVPIFAYSFMRQTQPPFWYGNGIEVRIHKWTISVGILKGHGSDPIDFEPLDVPVHQIREWGRPEQ